MVENSYPRISDLITFNLLSNEKISCRFDYTRGMACIIEKDQNNSRFVNIDFITGEYLYTPFQENENSIRAIQPFLLHHGSCLPGQPDTTQVPNITTTSTKPEFININPNLEQLFNKTLKPQNLKTQVA